MFDALMVVVVLIKAVFNSNHEPLVSILADISETNIRFEGT